MKHVYSLPNVTANYISPAGYPTVLIQFRPNPIRKIFWFLGLILTFPSLLFAQNSLNSGDFSTGSWGVGQAMGASAGSSLIITKAVSTSGDKYFRFYGDGSPCGEYQPNANGDFFTANVVVTTPDANCGSANAWRINVPTASSNVVFKTDGVNDGINQSVAFVVQGTVQSVSTVTQSPTSANVYPGQTVTVTATLSGSFSTGQAAYLRYTSDGFVNSTVVAMSGSGTTYTATIPGSANAPSANMNYYVFTSGDSGPAADGSNADLYTINLNNTGPNYPYTVKTGWTTALAGPWGTAGTWNAGAVPPTNANMGIVTIGHAVTLNQSALVGSVVLNTATANILTLNAAQTLSIAAGGSITRSSTATLSANATSTVRFLGNGSIGWLNTWGNLETGGALTVTGVQTIATSFQINSGGSISAAPTYGAAGSLVYNTGGAYNTGNEWTSTVTTGAAASGRPLNVTIQNAGTNVSLSGNRGLAGTMTVSPGATLTLNAGDLYVPVNFANTGTIVPSSKAVFFTGLTASTLNNSGTGNFDYLVIQKGAAVNVQLLSNLSVAATAGFPLQLVNTITGGGIDLNTFNLSLTGGASGILIGTATGPFVRNISGTGNLIISGGTKTVTRNALAGVNTLVLAAGVNVQLSDGIDFGTSLTTLNGTLTINSGGFVTGNTPTYGAASNLVYNSGTSYTVSTEWTGATDNIAGLGLPNNVTIQNSTTVNMPAAVRVIAGNLAIGTGSTFSLNATNGDFSLRGNWVNNGGTFNHSNRFVVFRGIAATTTVEKTGGTESFYELQINKGAGAFNLQFNSHITITSATGSPLQMLGTITAGSGINLNGFDLTLSGAGGNFDLGPGTALLRNVTGTGNVFITGAKTITRTTTNTVTFGASVILQPSATLTLSAASIATVNGTLQINSGGSVATNAPLYALTSTLVYNQGGAVATGTEWNSAVVTAVVTAGRPGNVTVQNSTDLTIPAASRAMFANLNVASGSLILNTSGTFFVGGNWTRAGGTTFTPSGATVQFWAITATFLPTTISVVGGETFGAVTIAKTVGINVNLSSNVTINGLLTLTTGRIVIGNNTLTINGNNSGTGATLSGTSASTLSIGGTGTLTAALGFTAGAQQLSTLILNRGTTGIVSLGSNLLIDNGSGSNNSTLTLTDGVIIVNTGFTLTVANTSITGSSSSFVNTAQPAGRMAYTITGAGTYTLSFPIGSSSTAYRPMVFTNLAQSGSNTYSVASWALPGSGVSAVYNSPLVGVSSVRYYPLTVTTLGNLTSIASVSLVIGADEASTLDVYTLAQVVSAQWNNIGTSGTGTRTSTSGISVASATTYFALGLTTFPVIYFGTTGNDANSGESVALRKLTLPAALAAVTNGGTVQSTSTVTAAASGYTISKNVNFNTAAGALTLPAGANPTITAKAVHPFVPANVNTGTDAITVTGHQLATGMPVTFENYGEAIGFMPTGINTGSDVLTIGSNIATGQPVIYQAYEGTAAGGLTHGTAYYAINTSATSIKLAASYSDALAGTPVVDITSTGSALSHGVISSVPQPLVSGTLYYAIVIDANTIELAATNADALTGTSIDLLTTGGGNHVAYFTPTYTGTITPSATILNITEPQAHIKSFLNLGSAATLTINLAAGTYSMQPTLPVNRTTTTTITGAGMGTTILDGKGKISTATSYHGFNFSTTAATPTVAISNLKVTGYYIGINRNSTFTSTTVSLDNIESSDNFSRGANFEGSAAITTLNIRNGIYSNNNGVGVSSYGIYVSGMARTTTNIRNNTVFGNRNSGIEIGSGTTSVLLVRGNTVSGVASSSPLHNSVTEYGIAVTQTAAVAGSGSGISNNEVQMYGRAGIECRGGIGNGSASGAASFRVASNYVNQAGGPFTIDPATSPQNEIRDIAGIAIGTLQSGTTSNLVVVDSNQVVNIQQPNSATSAYTAFGIVTGGTSIVHRCNIVTGCEIGMQAQSGGPGNENNTPDNFYSKDNSATTTNYLANRNSIFSNTDFGARNQVSGTINFEGNWWGDQTGPTHAANTSPAGVGEVLPAGTGIAYNAYMGADPDDNVGTSSGQRGIQVTSGKNFRLKPTANATSLAAPYVINQGINVGFGTTTTGFTDTLDVYSYPTTYTLPTESIKITRAMYLRGNFGNSPQPIITGTGNSVHPVEQTPNARMLINIAARNAGIENFNIRFSAPLFVIGVSNLIGMADTVNSDVSVIDGLRLKNNLIENTGSGQFYSFGIYLKSASRQSDPSIVNIENNTIRNAGGNYGFGSAIRMWGLRGEIVNNTTVGGFGIRWGNPATGGGITNISNNLIVGGVELNSPPASTTLNVTNNIFRRDSLSGGAHAMNLEIRFNQNASSVVNINNNLFENVGGSPYPYWGILSLRSQHVNIADNTFTAHSSSVGFNFIHASTRQQGTASNPTTFDNSVSIKGNIFNGNAQGTVGRTALSFARHRSTQTFNSVVVGGPGAEANQFKSDLGQFIELDPLTGPQAQITSGVCPGIAPFPSWDYAPTSSLPFNQLTGRDGNCNVSPTPVGMTEFDFSFDASENVYGVSGGDKLPTAMTLAELFEVENKIQHAIDYSLLGFVRVKANNAYVTTSSFISPYTSTKSVARAVLPTPIIDGDTITAEQGTYNETVTVNKSLTFDHSGSPTIIQNLTMNGSGKTLTLLDDFEVSSTLTLTDGIITTDSTLRVTNSATGAVVGGSASAHVNGRLNRAVVTSTNYDYMVGNGTDLERLRMNFSSLTGLTDATVSFTNTAPGTNLTNFQEVTNYYNEVLQSGYWAVTPNVGTSAATYNMRLWPTNYTDYPTPKNSYTILKRVGAGNWHQSGTYQDADDMNPTLVSTDGSISRTGMTNFSNFGVGASIDVPLPIRLSSFLANKKNKDVYLDWKTLSEVNVKQTEIERSSDGIAFQKISTISVNSEKGSLYRFIDPAPFSANSATLYYRLKFVDQDGKVDYSEIRLVRDQFSSREIELYPNPVLDRLIISQVASQSKISVFDQVGRKVISEQSLDGNELNVSHLPSGIYRLRIQSDTDTKSFPFVKK